MKQFMAPAALLALMLAGCTTSGPSTPPGENGTINPDYKPDTAAAPAPEPEPVVNTDGIDQSEAAIAARKPKDGEEVGVLETAQGKIVVMFFSDLAPNHVKRYKECFDKVFTGTYFHRVIPGFMIQGGDPNTKDADPSNDGQGGYGSMLTAEFNKVNHVRGILSTARTNDPNSAQSQFFLMHDRYPSLDGQYTVFGKAVSGLEVIDKIVNLPRGEADRPNDTSKSKIIKSYLTKWPVK
jgi:peptidyl-prolyl cis-trans isomerase B (cyclophilin B)